MNTSAEHLASNLAANETSLPPGALTGEVWLTVQTYQAQRLICGRRASQGKPAIMGLIDFAQALKGLWQAIRHNDPYADWHLLQVQELLHATRMQLHEIQQALTDLIDELHGPLEFAVAQSTRPQRVSLQFANPYAFRAAQLLGDYDRMLCADMTLQYLGVEIPAVLQARVKACGRQVRRVLAAPLGYRCFGITRQDVQLGTEPALRARERMGELPDEILEGRVLPRLRPPVMGESSGVWTPNPAGVVQQ